MNRRQTGRVNSDNLHLLWVTWKRLALASREMNTYRPLVNPRLMRKVIGCIFQRPALQASLYRLQF